MLEKEIFIPSEKSMVNRRENLVLYPYVRLNIFNAHARSFLKSELNGFLVWKLILIIEGF